MSKRICSLLLAVMLLLSSGNTVLACDEDQINTYVPQILFGDSAFSKASNEKVKMLLDALYLNSMQSDGQGKDKIEYLKRKKVRGIGSLSDLDIKHKELMKCSHNTWEYEYAGAEKQQNNRKEVLQNTVNKVFDFGFFNNLFGCKKGKCNSFAALLYYLHILSDYLADEPDETRTVVNDKEVPSYVGIASVPIRANKPSFTKNRRNIRESFYKPSQLDAQNRSGAAFANVGKDTLEMVGDRENMVSIKPSGWNQNKYNGLVTTQPPYIFNRCHLIAHQLGGKEEERNLITGTRYLNEAMIPYENKIKDYVTKTGNHVLYRVTPIFERDNKLASGVQLEAYSIEDSGKGVSFNVYCYNVQPGVDINYMNGNNEKADDILTKKNTIPFAVKNPTDNSPDLIYEMNKHLKILFDDQKNKNMYNSMMNDITTIANEARAIEKPEEVAKDYIELRRCEYKYLEVLTNYVPLLLEKEKFFRSTFK